MVGRMGITEALLARRPTGPAAPSVVVHPGLLEPASFPGFALYTRDAGNGDFSLLHGAEEPVYVSTWRKLEQIGVDTVYVRGEDREACLDYIESSLPHAVREGRTPPDLLADWAYRLTSRAMEALLARPGDGVYPRIRKMARLIAALLRRRPSAQWDMLAGAPSRYHIWSHSVNVGILLAGFARRALGAADETLLAEIAYGGILHDLGKTAVPQEILMKPAELTCDEFAQIVRHPGDGLGIARPHLRTSETAQRIIVQHHENACGSGYPSGRAGSAINVFARAAHIADAFDALTTRRPYGPAMDSRQAINTMITSMRGHFDMEMLREFIRHLGAGAEAAPVPMRITAGPPIPDDTGNRDCFPDEPAPWPLPATDFVPGLRRRLDEVLEAADSRCESVELLGDILASMEGRFSVRLREVLESEPDRRVAAAADDPVPDRSERGFARRMFRLMWQLDGWLEALDLPRAESGEGRRLRAEFGDCLRGLRRQMAALLADHGIEIIETAGSFDPRIHRPWGMPRLAVGQPGRVVRAGFLFRRGDYAEVLAPARVTGRPAAEAARPALTARG